MKKTILGYLRILIDFKVENSFQNSIENVLFIGLIAGLTYNGFLILVINLYFSRDHRSP